MKLRCMEAPLSMFSMVCKYGAKSGGEKIETKYHLDKLSDSFSLTVSLFFILHIVLSQAIQENKENHGICMQLLLPAALKGTAFLSPIVHLWLSFLPMNFHVSFHLTLKGL